MILQVIPMTLERLSYQPYYNNYEYDYEYNPLITLVEREIKLKSLQLGGDFLIDTPEHELVSSLCRIKSLEYLHVYSGLLDSDNQERICRSTNLKKIHES